jgi:hypothetical protein
VERTTYRVRASLLEMKLEDDSDIHLVIADPSKRRATVIAEFPAASCMAGASRIARTKMRRARNALVAACGSPSRSFKRLVGTATISGVGFFDQIHGQTGVAPNGIELGGRELHRGDVPESAGSSATSRRSASSSEWKLPPVVSDGLHSTPTAGSELYGRPVHQLPSALGRGSARPASLRRQSRRRRLRVLEPSREPRLEHLGAVLRRAFGSVVLRADNRYCGSAWKDGP